MSVLHNLPIVPSWVADLPLWILILSSIIGVPVLAIGLNVLAQVVGTPSHTRDRADG